MTTLMNKNMMKSLVAVVSIDCPFCCFNFHFNIL